MNWPTPNPIDRVAYGYEASWYRDPVWSCAWTYTNNKRQALRYAALALEWRKSHRIA